MYPSPFELHRPRDIGEALRLLTDLGDSAKLLAGGHSLLPTMKLRLATPAHLIDLSRVVQLREIREERGVIVIGAMATHWAVQSSEVVQRSVPFLSVVAGDIADTQIRNRGTIGGSMVHADPAADYPAALLAARAEIVCTSKRGERTVLVDDWFQGMMTTALAKGEIVTRVRVPATPKGGGAAYAKHKQPASRFAMPGVAANLELDSRERCVAARIGVTGAGPVPCRALRAEQLLLQRDSTAIAEAAEAASLEIEAEPGFQITDLDKRQLARAMTRQALESAWAAARFNPRRRFF